VVLHRVKTKKKMGGLHSEGHITMRGLGRRTENGVEWRGLLREARDQKGL
jgi:hypothetical protein